MDTYVRVPKPQDMRRRGEPLDEQDCDRNHSDGNDLRMNQPVDKESKASEETRVAPLDGKAYLDWLDARNRKFEEDRERNRQEREEMDRKQQAETKVWNDKFRYLMVTKFSS